MKVSLGLAYNQINKENLSFAKQIGADSIVVHLIDYKGINLSMPGYETSQNLAYTVNNLDLWTVENLKKLKKRINKYGLEISAIENFDPGSWYDILLDGPQKGKQLNLIAECIRNAGEAGIDTIHYNFSIAGIWGWYKDNIARGGAKSVVFDASKIDTEKPIPKGMVWNMVYDKNPDTGFIAPISHKEIWSRVSDFLIHVLPVAEQSGVKLAAHPDDPPVDRLRKTARLINSHEKFYRLLDIKDSPSNGINFCLGTIQEMQNGSIYRLLEDLLNKQTVHIIHFRNVRGKVPFYYEVFPDEGDIDMKKIISILKDYNYQGIIMPDHTPEITCDAPWHAGIAYTMGYLKGLLD